MLYNSMKFNNGLMRGRWLHATEIIETGMLHLFGITSMTENPKDLVVVKIAVHDRRVIFYIVLEMEEDEVKPTR